MHDARTLLELGDEAENALARRGYKIDLAALSDLVARRRQTVETADGLRSEVRRLGRRQSGATIEDIRTRGQQLKAQVHDIESVEQDIDRELTDILLGIPNLPADDVPDGDSEEFAVEVKRHGEPSVPAFDVRHHADLGEALGIFDFPRAGKLSGARFRVASGTGAKLERALASFFLDLHTEEHGYREYAVPTLVTRETMTGTGQLPKFEADLFRTEVGNRELFLIPSAEVPLTNLFAGETIAAAELPLAVTAYTPCFRAEAGAYGRDTRGMIRLHEFGKVELVRVCHPDDSRRQLQIMLGHAEACLARLSLAYRVVMLAAGDLGVSARVTYDIETWLPSQQRYREISSCSDCGTYQARRAGIKVRDGSRRLLAATLNGSGLPIGRTVVAILEQFQRADGGVDMPEALWPYTGFRGIAPDGSPEH